MTEIRYGTLPVRNGWIVSGPVRELEDDERERISILAERCRQRLLKIMLRKNRLRDSSQRWVLEVGFESIFDDGFRSEVRTRGGFTAILDTEDITCNFDLSPYQLAYVWKLSRIVPGLYWHYNFVRHFKNGVLYKNHHGELLEYPAWQLPSRLLRFVSKASRGR